MCWTGFLLDISSVGRLHHPWKMGAFSRRCLERGIAVVVAGRSNPDVLWFIICLLPCAVGSQSTTISHCFLLKFLSYLSGLRLHDYSRKTVKMAMDHNSATKNNILYKQKNIPSVALLSSVDDFSLRPELTEAPRLEIRLFRSSMNGYRPEPDCGIGLRKWSSKNPKGSLPVEDLFQKFFCLAPSFFNTNVFWDFFGVELTSWLNGESQKRAGEVRFCISAAHNVPQLAEARPKKLSKSQLNPIEASPKHLCVSLGESDYLTHFHSSSTMAIWLQVKTYRYSWTLKRFHLFGNRPRTSTDRLAAVDPPSCQVQ